MQAMWLALALFASAPLLAAPLVVNDSYRSPRNKERPLRKATTLIVLHTTEAHAKSSLNKLSERGEAHYCVVENGTVYRIVDHNREAFHAGRSMWQGKEDCDEFSIGIFPYIAFIIDQYRIFHVIDIEFSIFFFSIETDTALMIFVSVDFTCIKPLIGASAKNTPIRFAETEEKISQFHL